jgi:plastocyanin
MRAHAGSVALLAAVVALSGCVATLTKEQSSSVTPSTTSTPSTSQVPQAVPDLVSAVTTSGGAWVAPGSALTVTATPPPNAHGAVTYQWLLGPIAGVGPYPTFVVSSSNAIATPLIQPGDSSAIVFNQAGIFHLHCHPHPWMRSNVTVVDDGAAPERVVVHFVDGATPDDYHFVPENVTIPNGSTVVYENDGQMPHQTMILHQDSPLQVLPLTQPSGTITVNGSGWTRVVVAMADGAGAVGYAESDFYVAPLPAPQVTPFSGSYPLGEPSAAPIPSGTPADALDPTYEKSFSEQYPGTLYFNVSAQDPLANATNGQTPNTALIEAHVKAKDQTQDVLTCDTKDACNLMVKIPKGDYSVTIVGRQGVDVSYSGAITFVQDPVPPPLPVPYADMVQTQTMPGMSM